MRTTARWFEGVEADMDDAEGLKRRCEEGAHIQQALTGPLGQGLPGIRLRAQEAEGVAEIWLRHCPSSANLQAAVPGAMNDLMGRIPDANKFKYKTKNPVISTCPRHAASNAPDLCSFPIGVISPGPQRYNPQNCPPQRLAHARSVDIVAPAYSMRLKTEAKAIIMSTGVKVGPGTYPHPEACKEQADSRKPSLAKWSLYKTDRFPEKRQQEGPRVRDDEKKKELSRQLSAPPTFGTSTRGQAQRLAPSLTDLDRGHVLPPPRVPQPSLPSRREIMRYSDVHGG
eukprot:CAMPEP_0203869376 /NCGR_PEP_ID=MMETSP0359-20131031/17669_1 /ASSEMBLY_ACC=CAM_ASM_000338 /TAXON_ID=268821 /ORGANISM="Scrippsiella Hangoei, Strain SHTV-5" /LENGTH=283 /DNA_ID=CAMNT_0050787969 /DNA_START=112 /DNA_END=964 /DNA_ORIENTATION=+